MITGEALKGARRKIGKTQEELSESIDYSSRQISRFENNKNLGKYDKFLQLVVELNLYKPVKEDEKEVL